MFSYARRLLTTRPVLWMAALACATILVLPGAVLATLLVRPAAMLLLTGNLALAADLVPEPLDRASVVVASLGGILICVALFHRFYAVLLWESDEEKGAGWSRSWRDTRGRWRRFLLLNSIFLAILVAAAALVGGVTALLAAWPGADTLALLIGASLVVLLRTIGRIHVTLAARAALLDDHSIRSAWRTARLVVSKARRQVVAAWASLLSLGVAIWFGGKLVTPILQDTALDFPTGSSYALARESAQLAVAIPLEAFILVLSSGIWTAVFRGIEVEIEPTAARPWVPRALGVLVVLSIIGNGIPATTDVAWRNHEQERQRAIRSLEITPDEARDPVPSASVEERTSYRVRARLEQDRLRWSTTISYTNPSERPIRRLPVNVYPAAFSRELDDLPLADEVLSGASPNLVRERSSAGSFKVRTVTSRGRPLGWRLSGTVLRIKLDDDLASGEKVEIQVELQASLPAWPLRYGTWDGVTQLGNWIPTLPVEEREAGFHLYPYADIGDPFFSRTADYDVKIQALRGVGVVGTGALVGVSPVGGWRSWHFLANDVRDAAFAAGTALRGLERRTSGPMVRVWYNGADTITGYELLEEATAAVTWMSDSYGAPAARAVDVVLIDSPMGGMEYPGLVFVSTGASQLEGLPLIPDLITHAGFVSEQRRYIAGHELAHQWWYADVGNDQLLEPWLDEAFAEAATRLWLREIDGDERSWKVAHLEPIPQPAPGVIDEASTTFDSNSAYSDAIYDAGGAILLELRELMGPYRYEHLMRSWHERYKGRIATIDDFVDLAEEVGGADARALLERYRDP